MDPEDPFDINKILLEDPEVIDSNNTTPRDVDIVEDTKTDSNPSPCRQLSRKLSLKEFCLPTLNFDSDTSDDLPYVTHTIIENSSTFDENHEEKLDCCGNLHERYHNLYNCHLEESDPQENNPKKKNVRLSAKKQNKSDRLDDILAEQICIYEQSLENYGEPQEDLEVPPPAHGVSPWRQNQSDIEKEQRNVKEADKSDLIQYADDLEENNTNNFEEEDDATYLEEQEALLNSYRDELQKKRDLAEQNCNQRPPGRRGDRPPGRRGERPPGRRGERPCDINSERPSSEGKQESESCHNRYRMQNTPKRIGSAMESQTCNDSNSKCNAFRKNSDFPCSTYYQKKTETSEYYSTLDTVQRFFETRLDITNNINSKYCTRKPTSLSNMSSNLPMHYSLEEMQYLGQYEPETCDDISYPSTSADCNTIVEETLPDEQLPKEKENEENLK